MVTALVWMLMVSTNASSGFVSYSPPVLTLADCQKLQDGLAGEWIRLQSKCVQVNMILQSAK